MMTKHGIGNLWSPLKDMCSTIIPLWKNSSKNSLKGFYAGAVEALNAAITIST